MPSPRSHIHPAPLALSRLAAIPALFLAVLAVASAGCGGAQQGAEGPVDKSPPAEAAEKAPEGPEAECLALAGAKREKRPNEPAKISVKHVLIKYAGADKAGESVTRTRGAACLRAIEARDKLKGGADFGEVVKEYSEEPGAASREGSVAGIERSMVVEPFADAAFELDINQMSDVVETPYGFHVILRTE
jgi:parvulin-like peptidyl-prolyl isomerase